MRNTERSQQRVLVFYPASVHKDSFEAHALVKDLSVSGARLAIPGKVPPKFQLKFSPVPGAHEFEIICHLQWRSRTEECGVKFSKLCKRQKKVLEALVKFHRVEKEN